MLLYSFWYFWILSNSSRLSRRCTQAGLHSGFHLNIYDWLFFTVTELFIGVLIVNRRFGTFPPSLSRSFPSSVRPSIPPPSIHPSIPPSLACTFVGCTCCCDPFEVWPGFTIVWNSLKWFLENRYVSNRKNPQNVFETTLKITRKSTQRCAILTWLIMTT